jgi:N-dimethylarginine dimethylaminohydrolase
MNAYGAIRRIYVRPPNDDAFQAWQAYGWHAEPDVAAATAEHAAFVEILSAAVPEVIVGTGPVPDDPDAIYAYDPILVIDAGIIPLRPGKEGRRGEPAVITAELAAAGCEILPPLEAPETEKAATCSSSTTERSSSGSATGPTRPPWRSSGRDSQTHRSTSSRSTSRTSAARRSACT